MVAKGKKVVLLLALMGVLSAFLSSVNLTNLQMSGFSVPSNFAGAALNLSTIYASAINSSIFQGYLANSKAYGSVYSMMPIELKVQWPKGYKYNCSAYSQMGINTTCTFNYSSINAKISAFAKAATPYSQAQFAMGFDMESANFSSSSFASYFTSSLTALSSAISGGLYSVPIEVFDGADRFAANGIIANYTAANFVKDMQLILSQNPYLPFYGPGATQGADASWMGTFDTLKSNSYFSFSVKCTIFNNTNNLTIADLLSQQNYRNFILQRFSYNGQIINPSTGRVIITEARITDGVGIDGLTNTFAAALWAIDFALEFAAFGGKSIRFPCDITNGSLQTMLGPAPNYTPTPLYYGMLFLSAISYIAPSLGQVNVTAGTSSNVKVYALASSGNQLQLVLINKDVNPNASGTVEVSVYSNDIMQCTYLTAPSLSSTGNVTWAGYTFLGGSATPLGNYTVFRNYPQGNYTYQVPLNYSQAAICTIGTPNTKFPYLEKGEKYATFLAVMVMAMIVFAL